MALEEDPKSIALEEGQDPGPSSRVTEPIQHPILTQNFIQKQGVALYATAYIQVAVCLPKGADLPAQTWVPLKTAPTFAQTIPVKTLISKTTAMPERLHQHSGMAGCARAGMAGDTALSCTGSESSLNGG